MKQLLLLFLITGIIGCSKDEDMKINSEVSTPSVTGVTFAKVGSGSEYYTKVNLTVNIPVQGSVKSITFLRGSNKRTNAISGPSTGLYSVIDPTIAWSPGGYYTFIFVLQDNTEISSSQYKVE